MYIYVLKLSQGKWYVGKTEKTAMQRYKEHLSGAGSAWTRKYKPIELVECSQGDKFDEDKKTKQYMDRYGVDNVRGGAYSQMKLDNASLVSLKREMNGANDNCNKCGKSGHFMRNCTSKTTKPCATEIFEVEMVWVCDNCNREFETEKGVKTHQQFHCRQKKKKCQRCGRKNHLARTCYAKTNIYGDNLDDHCRQQKKKCKRCGRKNHYARTCYAANHVKGYYLED